MQLRKFKHVVPRPEDVVVPQFVQSTVKSVEKTTERHGRKFKRIVRTPVVEVISPVTFENRGVDCRLFTVENMLSQGIDLFKQQPITTPFIKASLDDVSKVREECENFDPSNLTEKDFPPMNQQSND